ncbi:MAG: polysaccharide deacetylase [Deltaproteobacteria bacterium]|nr:polysaccharide deacetylase [Deltaproteobacteria bacterium]
MRRMFFRICLAVFFIAASFSGCIAFAADGITGLKAIFEPITDKAEARRVLIAIREFERSSKKWRLAVDPETFETIILPVHDTARTDDSAWKDTPFIRALEIYNARPQGITNNGVIAGNADGVFLTVDLCPSKKAFDREMFTRTIKAAGGHGAPVAIAISGLWIERHKAQFDWLMDKAREGALRITWVNHSFTHPFDPERPLEENFLLTDGVDFEKEVLETERLLLERGLMPSPFFRFPGLVSDERLHSRLKAMSLIPIGANAWLAKGERPKTGSIILVHGNGNEPDGIKRLYEYYDASTGKARLLPLREAFTGVVD